MAAKPTYEELEQSVKELESQVTNLNDVVEFLKETDERYSSLLEASPDPIVVYDMEGRATYINPAFSETFGWSPDELLGKRIDFVPEENWPETKAAIRRMIQGKKVQLFETKRLTKDNRTLDIQLSSSLFQGIDGKPYGNIVILRDITMQKLAEETIRKSHDELEQRVKERTAELVLINENLQQEIVDRQHAEEALRESEKRFRRLVETMNDGIGIQDENGLITYVNNKFCQMLDYKPDDFIGKPVTNFLDDHNRQILKNQTAARRKGKVKPYEIEWTCKDGRKIQTVMSPQAIFNDVGQFKGSFSVITDISTLKQVEGVLRESEERYRALAENSRVGFWHITLEGYTIYLNPAMCSMLEIESPEELSGLTYHPFFTTESLEIMKHERATRPKTKGSSYEVEIIGKNGGRRNVMISGAPILSAEDTLQSFIGTFTDITSRKKTEEALRESEENFRALAENANDGILIAVEDGRHAYANRCAAEITGYSVSELLKTTIRDLAHPDEFEKINKRYKTIIAGKPFQSQYETMIIRKDGKEVPIEVASAKFTWHGQPADIVIIRDISERKRIEEELRKAHDELENRVEERTRELKIQKSNLEEANIALQVLLEKRQEDKKETEDNVLTNVKELVAPYFEKIKKTKLDDQQKAFLSIMESYLNDIISPFTRKISLKYLNLTPTEIQVANLIRYGSNSKEIAELMGVSPRTIYNHRKNIRKKFGLKNKKTNLRSHLLSTH